MEDERTRLFRALFDAEYDYVYHSLRRLGVQARDLEDLAHDVFVAVYENLARYDRSRPVRPWLFAFAFRKASDYRRLARHKTALGVPDDTRAEGAPTAEDDAARREGVAIVERILETIPLDQRAVFIQYEIDEVSMQDIAESMGIPVNTAYSRLRLARATFAEGAKTFQRGGAR
jgi:RNA polymerase sigma-70 factor (ECF subfamily)